MPVRESPRASLRIADLARYVTATTHPSAFLGTRDGDARRLAMEVLVDDLRRVRAVLDG